MVSTSYSASAVRTPVGVISRIGAWSIDNPNKLPDLEAIFPRHIESLREAFFNDNKRKIRKLNEALLKYLAEGESALDKEGVATAKQTLATLRSRFGYCDGCAKDAVVVLVRKRYGGT